MEGVGLWLRSSVRLFYYWTCCFITRDLLHFC
ncbi:protein of unknown function [Methylococcus capsulatus]|uniref:Uncharacterized protein n=1 Tax=Methylococcus capsulatus TaxID=414 RepID=A0AA35UK67_METCP|nr:protein of unknown function [Methylococcus capsulatus]